MIIKNIKAQEIYNGLGSMTIQCIITLNNNLSIAATISSQFLQLEYTILHKDQALSVHQQIQNAITFINTTIAPQLEQKQLNALAMDSLLMDLNAPANITLPISIALFKAQAALEQIETYQFIQSISGTKELKIPMPIISIFQGRMPYSQKNILEFLSIPTQNSIKTALQDAAAFQQHLQTMLTLKKHPLTITESGAFAPAIFSNEEYFEILLQTQKTLPLTFYNFGLNIAACELYDTRTKTYLWNNGALITKDLIAQYQDLIQNYPITYIQDSLSSQDFDGWNEIKQELPANIMLAADTLFCSNPMHIRKGVLQQITPYVIIRPEHLGTVSKTIAAIDVCKYNKIPFIIASDLDFTAETFAVDLAFGTGATFIKAGGMNRFEHVAKYNRMLMIESHNIAHK